MPLKHRLYECPDCGHSEDRGMNAAKNIDRWFDGIFIPERSKAASSAVLGCGADKPRLSHPAAVMKQEIDGKPKIVQLSLF